MSIKRSTIVLSIDEKIKLHEEYKDYEKSGYLGDDAYLRIVVEKAMAEAGIGYALFPMVAQQIMFKIYQETFETVHYKSTL